MAENGLTWEEAISIFLSADENESSSTWLKAEMAMVVEDRFGGQDRRARSRALHNFASEVRYSTSTLRHYARTARFFPAGAGTRVPDLSFTMHRVAANHAPDRETAQMALGKAAEAEWSTRELQDFLVQNFGLKLDGVLETAADDRILLDNQDLVQLLRRFDGLRVRLQLKVVAEEDV